ncbi:hypothetical protein AMTRI_Chr04g184140 [Amborella trichopoda]
MVDYCDYELLIMNYQGKYFLKARQQYFHLLLHSKFSILHVESDIIYFIIFFLFTIQCTMFSTLLVWISNMFIFFLIKIWRNSFFCTSADGFSDEIPSNSSSFPFS